MKETKNRLRTGANTLRLAALALSLGATTSAVAAGWWQSGNEWNAATWDGYSTDYFFASWNDVAMTFADLYADSATLNVGHSDSTSHMVTFTADDSNKGLSLTGGLNVGYADNARGDLTLATGAFSFSGDVNLGTIAGSAASLAVNSGASLSVGANFNFANGASSLTINGGTMTVDGASTWCWTDAAVGDATITVSNGGKLSINGAYSDGDAINAIWGSGGQKVTINVDGGVFECPAGDVMLGAYGTWDNTSGEVAITIDNDGEFSCGSTTTPKTLMLGRYGSEKFTVNVNSGAMLSAGRITRGGNGTVALNVNGGTIRVLGEYTDGNAFISNVPMTIGANGGTIDTNGKAITIAPEISGTGTLRIIGGGSVTFSVAPTCTVTADADTTVTGATLSSAAISITAPSSDWSSKTLPTTAGTKTVTSGNWATYADGGASYQQTLGTDTAYVALVDVEDSASGATIAGIEDNMTATSTYNENTYVLVGNGNANYVVGGAKVASTSGKDYKLTYTGDSFVQLEGSSTTADYVYGSSYYATINSTVNGNSCVVIKDGAKVTGSVFGGLSVYDFYNSGTSHPKFTGNSLVSIESLQDDNTGTQLGGDCPKGWNRNYNKYLVVGGSVVLGLHNYSLVNVDGDTSVEINLADGTTGTFSKTIVGGNASLINNSNQNSPSHTGNASVSIKAPNTVTFNQPIYGAGFAIRSGSPVDGNTSVTIDGGTYSSTICAASSVGTVSGTATLTLKAGVFTGVIKGYNTDSNSGSSATGGSILAIEGDIDLSACSISNFGKITIAKGKTVTISSSQVSMFSAQGLSVEENNGIYTAKYAPKYFWVGEGGDKNWNNAANWKVGDTSETATTADSAPTASDPVTISTEDSIVIDSADCAAQQITVDAAVTFTGNVLAIGGATGSGTITLGDGAGFSVTSNVTIPNDIAVTASAESPAVITSPSGVGVTLTGALLESTGYLKFTGNGSCHYLNLSANNFKGTIEIDVGSTAGDFMTTASGSATVKWVVSSYTAKSTKTETSNLVSQGTTSGEVVCEFGSLTGTLYDANAASHGCVIFTVGALCGSGETMNLTYRGVNNESRDSAFKMVGEGTFAINATYVRRYECDSGTIELMTADSLPRSGGTVNFNGGALKLNSAITSATDPSSQFVFVDGKTAILDDGGVTREFATAIGNNTSANFVKKGAGTLTLSAEPAYTGTTTVEAGVLKMPVGSTYTLGENTVVMTNGEYLYFTPVVSATTENAATVIAGATQYEVVSVSGSTLDLSGVTVPADVYIGVAPGQALTVTTGENAVNAKVITTVNGEVVDITTYYANGTSGTIAVTSGSAIDAGEFADEVVPAVSEETVDDTTVTFTVTNFKKGLYYGVADGTSPELSETGVKLTQSQDDAGTGVPLTADMPAEGVKYYKVVVSDTAE